MAYHLRIWTLSLALLGFVALFTTPQAQASSLEAEGLLEKALDQLTSQQHADALSTLEILIERYPRFQLAHMMRADLLYLQANRLATIGEPLNKAQSDLLQAEALARLKAIKQLASHQKPAYVLGTMPNRLKHVITIDLSASRAYLFEVNANEWAFIASYYLTQGKKGAGKEKEGDKRTPIGAYRLQKPIPAHALSSFYGAGALPLDYPNMWDKRNQRTGHGIWLHGTPFEQYSRPPLASDGCMVFSNDDMGFFLKRLNWQSTLVITDTQLVWKSAETDSLAQTLQHHIEQWRQSWQQQRIEPYLKFYAKDFLSDKGENKQQWTQRKQQLFALGQAHEIQTDQLLMVRYPAHDNLIMTEFDQRYQRGMRIDVERKRLWWQKQQGEWLIIQEEVLAN